MKRAISLVSGLAVLILTLSGPSYAQGLGILRQLAPKLPEIGLGTVLSSALSYVMDKFLNKKEEPITPEAMYLLGYAYASGRHGVRVDYGEAAKWYKKSAAKEYVRAQVALAMLYLDGHGVEKNAFEARKLCRAADLRDSAYGKYCLARLDFASNDLDEVIRNATLLLAAGDLPDQVCSAALNMRGLAYAWKKQFSSSIDDLTRAISLNHNDKCAYVNLGVAYSGEGEPLDAIGAFSEALRLSPNDTDAEIYYYRGLSYNDTNQFVLAIADFDQAIRLNPAHANAYTNRGYAHSQTGQLNLALVDLNTAITLDQNDYRKYIDRGNVYYSQGRYNEAITDFTKSLQLQQSEIAYIARGNASDQIGQSHRAIDDYTEAIRLTPGNLPAYHNRGRAYVKLGKFNLAIADFDEVIRTDTKNFKMTYCLRGHVYEQMGQQDRAFSDYVSGGCSVSNTKK